MIGKTISNYKILEKIGEGGMGVVYKAQDTKLGRVIALKALPEEFAQDRERLARFEREAKLLASLNHPNIATIYGLEESEGLNFLTLELVEGETLAGKLTSGPIKVQEALEMCRQIAEALESAHERGIIHRDLKPSNIKVTPEGKIKVLDFGLAKAFEVAEVGDAAGMDPYKSPTLTVGSSRSGVIMGTAAYMSPEQARGKALDKRTDIWSFGCVFYELLTGQQLFKGETTSDMVAGILKQEPDWKALPQELPVKIRDLLGRCLQKDPNKRLHDIADARIEIEEVQSKPSGPTIESLAETEEIQPLTKKQSFPWGLTAIIAVIVALLSSVAVWILKPHPTPRPRIVKRFAISLPSGHRIGSGSFGDDLALSPDGKNLVYSAFNGENYMLYLRPLDQLEATPIPGTEGANHPFFSPDGQQVGFSSGGKLKKVILSGGTPLVICEEEASGTWAPDGNIIMGSNTEGLVQVSSSEGNPQPLTTLDKENGETSHRWPQVLPGGKAVLFTVRRESGNDDSRIAVCDLETGEHRILIDETGFNARYVPSGHIVYIRAGVLMTVLFDLQKLQVTGSPVPLSYNIVFKTGGASVYTVSNDSTFIYLPGGIEGEKRSLVWVDRKGGETPIAAEKRHYGTPRISPDGKKVAVSIYDETNYDIWVHDLEREALSRITFKANNRCPAWTPDGQRLLFVSDRIRAVDIYSKKADGSGEVELVLSSDYTKFGLSLSADGSLLGYYEVNPGPTFRDICVMNLKDHSTMPLVNSFAHERAPAVSPDGRWIAYISDESGKWEVYVAPNADSGGKWKISTDGGTEPVWSPDGRELFYWAENKMMAVSVETDPAFEPGKPQELFEKRYYRIISTPNYSIHPDGDRFLMIKQEEDLSADQMIVILNWDEELKQLVPVEKR